MNYHPVLLKQVQRSEEKLIFAIQIKKHARTCTDYFIGREITTVLKIALNYVTHVTTLPFTQKKKN